MQSRLSSLFKFAVFGLQLGISACATQGIPSGQPIALNSVKRLAIVEFVDAKPIGITTVKTDYARADNLFEALGLMHSENKEIAGGLEQVRPLADAIEPEHPAEHFATALKTALVARGIAVTDVILHQVDLSAGRTAMRGYTVSALAEAHSEYVLIIAPEIKIHSDGARMQFDLNTSVYRNDAYDPLYEQSFGRVSDAVQGDTFDARLQQWMASDHGLFTQELDQSVTTFTAECAGLFPVYKHD